MAFSVAPFVWEWRNFRLRPLVPLQTCSSLHRRREASIPAQWKKRVSEMERGCLPRQLNDEDTREIEKVATTVTEHIKRNESAEGVEHWKMHSIYKVPEPMAAINSEAFAPKVVSLGPYHHGEDHLKPMEVHKHRAAQQFMIQNSKKCTKDYVEALWEVLPELMDSYSQLDHDWMGENNRGRFLELMLIDGCFLLEILRICSLKDCQGYDEHDPVFSGSGLAFNFYLWFDLYMLENQVPSTALERLLTVQNDKTPDENCTLINNLISLFVIRRQDTGVTRGLHMLDIARKILAEPEGIELSEEEKAEAVRSFLEEMGGLPHTMNEIHAAFDKMTTPAKCRSVTELCHAGVEFTPANGEVTSLSSIEFNDGVLTMPVIRPYDLEVLAPNIVAFERMHHGTPNATYYISFIKGLLASAADVEHLRSLKIIQSTDLSDDEIVQTFKRLTYGELGVGLFSRLYRIQDQLDKFYLKRTRGCEGRLWKWITDLKEKYFNYPWTFIAVVSATLLLALTVAQTYYAARPYWAIKHKNN
ncbi:UPF0481-like protein [Cinnamomum micranthum f. kanehirae]|uniref:UPF0481-like protein n=1 Tax=Cinnamomum micranthum f. kanehirae TaxID=337451 RepID=A0A443P7W9_9MAGN|nr:UPF0481-like protein [Cinnamomum micranthum f. kanehirae]